MDNSECFWDEFRDWCEDEGVSLEYREDWIMNWTCWLSALAAAGNQDAFDELVKLKDGMGDLPEADRD